MIKTISRLCLALGVAAALGDAPAHAAAAATTVKIENFTFEPQTLTIHAGTTITWVNDDDIPHLVAENEGRFRSAALDTGDSYSETLTAPGTIEYFCALHPHMTGTIVVVP